MIFNPSTTRAYILCGIVIKSIDSHAASGESDLTPPLTQRCPYIREYRNPLRELAPSLRQSCQEGYIRIKHVS